MDPLQGLQGGPQDPGSDGSDQAALLGQRNETIRRNELSVVRLPPQKRLAGKHLAIRHLDLGLEHEEELVLGEGAFELVEKPDAVAGFVADFGTVANDLSETFALGPLDGHDGVAEMGRRIARHRIDAGDADGERKLPLTFRGFHAHRRQGLQGLGTEIGCVAQDGEGIGTDTGEIDGFADHLADAVDH